MNASPEETVTIVIKTLLRPHALRCCIASIRRFYPRIRILVADDSGYRSLAAREAAIDAYYLLPWDSGASFGRNFLVGRVRTPYVMVVDDDTLFDPATDLAAACRVLDSTPPIDLVAGHYRPARWWGCFELDPWRRTLYQLFGRARTVVAGFPLYDFVPQFYVGRTDKVRDVGWDDELKTLDHLQFFWRARGRVAATVLPGFSALNTSEGNPRYDALRWGRVDRYRDLQLRKLGVGVREIVDVEEDPRLAPPPDALDPRALAPAAPGHLQAPNRAPGRLPRPTLAIGLGTGRCGTSSLSRALSEACGREISHERRPLLAWDAGRSEVFAHLDRLGDGGPFFGDVAFYYLPHVETILAWGESRGVRVRLVCLQRDREATVESYRRKVRPYRANHWMNHDGRRWRRSPAWDPCYPKLDHCRGLGEAIGAYWDLYAATAEQLARRHPAAFRVFPTEALNAVGELADLTRFVTLEAALSTTVGIRLNAAATTSRDQPEHPEPLALAGSGQRPGAETIRRGAR